jgi:DNA-binding transcriptional ArsR family regulator
MPNQLDQLDSVLHALAAPSRRGMVERLGRGPASVTELARPIGLSLPAALQHLELLEAAGLVRSEKVGRTRTCRLQDAALRTVDDWIAAQRSTWERRLDQLDVYLADRPPEGPA